MIGFENNSKCVICGNVAMKTPITIKTGPRLGKKRFKYFIGINSKLHPTKKTTNPEVMTEEII
jgi:hypothetical protein